MLRLQQLLAQAGYLPLDWKPTGGAWRERCAPSCGRLLIRRRAASAGATRTRQTSYVRSGSAGAPNVITRGAVMMFEDNHGLAVDAYAGEKVWHAAARRRDRRQAPRQRLQLRLCAP